MSDKWFMFVKDPRKICKYGAKCYQKNPKHDEDFKHPPKTLKRNRMKHKPDRDSKRFKPSPGGEGTTGHITNPKQEINDRNFSSNLEINKNSDDEGKTEEVSSSSLVDYSSVIKIPEEISFYEKDTDKSIFKELFLVDMPSDFLQFYQCIEDDEHFVKILSSVNLELIGPFDMLLGRLPVVDDKELYLIHWRFFYDPPEFQAVLKRKGSSEYHIGYFRDDPDSTPVFLASTDSAKGCHIKPIANNIFGAVYVYLQNEKKSSPFTSMACQKLMEKVKKWAEEYKYSLKEYDMKERLAQTVTKTLHGAGLVVPYNKKTHLGYRRLVDTDANIRKQFTKLEAAKTQSEKDKVLAELQPVITYANIAVDECDFGTGLEAGIDLFCSGLKELQSSAVSSLSVAYSLLKRDAYSKIIQAHIKYRRKGPNMSILASK